MLKGDMLRTPSTYSTVTVQCLGTALLSYEGVCSFGSFSFLLFYANALIGADRDERGDTGGDTTILPKSPYISPRGAILQYCSVFSPGNPKTPDERELSTRTYHSVALLRCLPTASHI